MSNDKYRMTWSEVEEGLSLIDDPGNKVYGVPRGGMIIAGFLHFAQNVMTPDEADIILDDIIDSGRTRDEYQKRFPMKDFVALVDKTGKDKNIGWVVFPWESEEDSIEDAVVRQIQYIGDDVTREGLIDTPARVKRSWDELFSGYNQDPKDVMTTFTEGTCDQMVILKDIEFFSTCEHHLLPFFGRAHIAYIPKKKIIGISKLARLLEIYTRRLQIQERIGDQVTEAIKEHLDPKGAACIIEGTHFCMTARGVQKQHSKMVTSSVVGVFRDNGPAREELMRLAT